MKSHHAPKVTDASRGVPVPMIAKEFKTRRWESKPVQYGGMLVNGWVSTQPAPTADLQAAHAAAKQRQQGDRRGALAGTKRTRAVAGTAETQPFISLEEFESSRRAEARLRRAAAVAEAGDDGGEGLDADEPRDAQEQRDDAQEQQDVESRSPAQAVNACAASQPPVDRAPDSILEDSSSVEHDDDEKKEL